MMQEVNQFYYLSSLLPFIPNVTKCGIAIQDEFCRQFVEYENKISYPGLYLCQVSIRKNSEQFYILTEHIHTLSIELELACK